MNPGLALLSMAAMPFLAYRAYEFGRRMRPLSLAIQQQLGTLTAQVEQNLRGARVVKAFAQEDAQIDAFDTENDDWFDLSVAAAKLRSINVPLLDLIANIGTVAIIWYGGYAGHPRPTDAGRTGRLFHLSWANSSCPCAASA